MQKLGTVLFKDNNNESRFFIAYYTNDTSVTRIDIYQEMNEYDPVSGKGIVSGYYSDGKEYHYGDDALCLRINKCITKVTVAPGKTEQDFDTNDLGLEFVVTKIGEDIYSKMITINGEITEEIFRTGDTEIHFDSISEDSTFAIQPIVFGLYKKYGDLHDLVRDDLSTSSLEYYTLDELRARYPGQLDHIEEMDLLCVQSMKEAYDRLEEFKESVIARSKVEEDVLVSIDIETTGLNMGLFGEDCITGIVLGDTTDRSTYYPFRQESCPYNLPLWYLHDIADVVNNLPSNVRVATYNGKMEQSGFLKDRDMYIKFCEYAKEWNCTPTQNLYKNHSEIEQSDTRYLNSKNYKAFVEGKQVNNDLWIRDDVDGLHISIKLDQRRMKGLHALKTQATKITGKFWVELHNIFKGDIKFNKLPPDLITIYACPDTCNTIRVVQELESKFPKSEMEVLNLEHKLNRVKTCNEFFGMRTDAYLLENLIRQQEFMRDMLERRFKEIHKTSKNIRSYDVKANIFYNQLKADVIVRTKVGKPSASKHALAAILESGSIPKDKVRPEEEWPPDISIFVKEDGTPTTWDKLTKEEKSIIKKESASNVKDNDRRIRILTAVTGKELASNRYPSLLILSAYNKLCKEIGALKRIKKKSKRDRVQFYITSDGADSDRQTSDAHQYSDTMKKVILPDTPEHNLISCDYSQVEIRVLGFVAEEYELTNLLTDPDVDGHRAILSRIEGTPMYLISDEERKKKKAVNFGVIYGMTEYGLARGAHGPNYTKSQLVEKIEAITAFFNGLPNVKAFKDAVEEFVLKNGYVQTLFGYIRHFKQVLEVECTKADISKAKKAAFNTCIQGFAATLMKLAEVNYDEYIRTMGWDECVEVDGVMYPKVRLMLSIHDEVLISAHKSIPMAAIIKMCKDCQEISIKGAPPFFACPAFVDNWYVAKNSAYEIPVKLRDQIVKAYEEDGVDITVGKDYLKMINEFRDTQLKTYMESLVDEYRTVEAVAEHVNDPFLTHELIKRYIKGDEKLTHVEKIKLATERFMSGYAPSEVVTVEFKDKYIDDDESMDEYIRFGANGEQVFEDRDEDDDMEEDDYTTIPSEFNKTFEELEQDYAVYTMRECIIDMTSFTQTYDDRKTVGEYVYSAVMRVAKENGGEYRIVMLINGKLYPTKATIGYIPDKISAAIKMACLKEVS